jgi:hypothetical protein
MPQNSPEESLSRGTPRRVSRSILPPLLVFVGGLAYTLGALHYQVGTLAAPKSGLFPVGVGVLLLVASGYSLVVEYARPSPPPEALGPDWRRVPAICAAIWAFAALLKPAGYVIASAVLCGLLVFILGRRPWWLDVGIGVATAAVTYYFFSVLGVPLPAGVLPF